MVLIGCSFHDDDIIVPERFKDLRPPVAEVAVSNDQTLFVIAELSCHSFHAVGSTAWN